MVRTPGSVEETGNSLFHIIFHIGSTVSSLTLDKCKHQFVKGKREITELVFNKLK